MREVRSRLLASAPGKLMLAGEYAVLDGAAAVVTAVDRRLRAGLVSVEQASTALGRPDQPWREAGPEARATRELAERSFGATPSDGVSDGVIIADASALRDGELKLGLGSSSATAAAVAALFWARGGRDLDDRGARDRVLAVALRGHLAVAPAGSGADVAASVLGGVLVYRRPARHGTDGAAEGERPVDESTLEHASARAIVAPLVFPEHVYPSVVFVGKSARTSALVARVRDLRERDPIAYERATSPIRSACAAMRVALERSDVDAIIGETGAHHRALAALGRHANAPIVEARLSKVAQIAEARHGAAKPSGAGGGDVAVAFFRDEDRRESFEAECRREGFVPLALRLGASGVRIEPGSTSPEGS